MAAHMLSPLLEYVAISHWSWSYMWPVAQLIRILQQLIIKNRLIIELMIQAFLLVWNLSKHYTVIIYQSAFLWKVRTLEPLKNDTWREINDSVGFFSFKNSHRLTALDSFRRGQSQSYRSLLGLIDAYDFTASLHQSHCTASHCPCSLLKHPAGRLMLESRRQSRLHWTFKPSLTMIWYRIWIQTCCIPPRQ